MAMLHVRDVDLGKVKVDVELKLGISGEIDDVTLKMRTVADALAGRLVHPEERLVCDHTEEIDEIAKLKKFLDAASTDVERFRAQHDKDLTLIEGLQEARGGSIRAATEWRDQTIELGAKISRLETDKAEVLQALAMMARDHLGCDCGLGPVGCIGIKGDGAGFGCDRCCAHAGVDGWCVRLPDLENESEVSPAASLMRVVPPVQSHGGAVGEDVSPALSGQEAGDGAEPEREHGAHSPVLPVGASAGAPVAGVAPVRGAGGPDGSEPAAQPGAHGGAAQAARIEGRGGPGGDREVVARQRCTAYADGEHRTSIYTACACTGGSFIPDSVWSSPDIDPAIYPGRAADFDRDRTEGKETTDQAASSGAGHPVNDSPGAIAGEKAAETRTAAPEASEERTSDHGATVAGEAGPALQPDPRLPDEVDATMALLRQGEAAAESGQVSAAASKAILDKIESDWLHGKAPEEVKTSIADARWGAPPISTLPELLCFHLWQPGAGEAECGETTDADFELLPLGEKPPADHACVDCADLVAWAEPGRLSQLPVEPQTELGLGAEARPDDGKRPCARCSHPTKRFCSSESTVVGLWLPFRGKPLCARCSGILRDQEKAQKPRCKGFNKAAGAPCESEPKPGSGFCGRHSPKNVAVAG